VFAIESALGLIFISESGAISSAVGITSPSHALFEWVVQEGIDLRKGWELHFKLGKARQ